MFGSGFLLLSIRVTNGGKYFNRVTLLINLVTKKSNAIDWILQYGGHKTNSVERWARRLTEETER